MYLTDVYTNITTSISATVGTTSASIGTAIAPLFWAAIGVYIVYQAWNIIYTQNDVNIGEVMKFIGSLSMVSIICFNGDWYITYIVPFFQDLAPNLSASITGDTANPTNMLEQYWSSYNPLFEALNKQAEDTDWYDFFGWGSIIFCYVFAMLCRAIIVLVLAINLIISSFMLNMILSLGLLFIPAFFFPATRNFFTLWVGQVMNYVLLAFLYVVAASLVSNFLLNRVNEAVKSDTGITVFIDELIIITVIFVYLINQISTVAQGLSGGVSVGTIGVGVGRTLNSIGNSSRGISGAAKGIKAGRKLLGKIGNIGKSGAS